ncbi:hypothetical protein WR25_19904 [Diploscapter pachys]|uniref:Uncharacterized protein n=1 Tax=Diploscapter pachys TaxID=2018661 RepID=A0A2A2JX27_9BILA|nr:hypothetical protein WR25_19904 [Diploscapter pachys]
MTLNAQAPRLLRHEVDVDRSPPFPGRIARQADHRVLGDDRAHQPALVEYGDRGAIGQPPGQAGGEARRRHRAAAAVGQADTALERPHEQIATAHFDERYVGAIGQPRGCRFAPLAYGDQLRLVHRIHERHQMRVGHRYRGEQAVACQRRHHRLDDPRIRAGQRPCRRIQPRRPRGLAHRIDTRRHIGIALDIGGRRLQRHIGGIDAQRLEPRPRHAAQAVQARLRLAAIRIEHAHRKRSVASALPQQQQPVTAHRPAPVGQRPRHRRPVRIAQRQRTRVDQRKIVAGPMAFHEVEPHCTHPVIGTYPCHLCSAWRAPYTRARRQASR